MRFTHEVLSTRVDLCNQANSLIKWCVQLEWIFARTMKLARDFQFKNPTRSVHEFSVFLDNQLENPGRLV